MIKLRCEFEILEQDGTRPLLIRDTGHACGKMTLTNDMDNVVPWLYEQGYLWPERKLEYIDSQGERTGVLHAREVFCGFH